jgi:hypothetical protein
MYPHLAFLMLFDIFCGRLVYFVAIWHILWPFGIFCGHLEYITLVLWDILWPFGIFYGSFPSFGILYQEKSGKP